MKKERRKEIRKAVQLKKNKWDFIQKLKGTKDRPSTNSWRQRTANEKTQEYFLLLQFLSIHYSFPSFSWTDLFLFYVPFSSIDEKKERRKQNGYKAKINNNYYLYKSNFRAKMSANIALNAETLSLWLVNDEFYNLYCIQLDVK